MKKDAPTASLMPQTIAIPGNALVLLIGPSGAGKSTFARRHFRSTEVLSSDRFRALVSDDERDQSATLDAFEVLRLILRKRLRRRLLTVVDATNLRKHARSRLLAIAYQYGAPAIGIAFDLGKDTYHRQNAVRPDRLTAFDVLADQIEQFESALKEMPNESFDALHVLKDRAEVVIQRDSSELLS